MQAIRQTQQLNKRELENATPPSASWHADYRDTAWVYVGGLPFDLTEGDVVIICSQFGNPTHLNLVRDKETGKSKGFGFLKYEDQRSCDLAVDNLTGAEVLGKLLRVDHTRYKKRDDEDDDTYRIDRLEAEQAAEKSGKRVSDTEESDDEKQRRKRRKARFDDNKRLAIKENGELLGPSRVRDDEDDEDDDENRARERHRERKHKHHHRSGNGEDADRPLDRRTPDSISSKRRYGETRADRDGPESRHRDEPGQRTRSSRGELDNDLRKHKSKRRSPSRGRDQETSHHERHRSTSDSRERKPRRPPGSDEENDRHQSARNGKTRRAERSHE